MDVRMPDGTVVKNVPGNVTQQQVMEMYQKSQGASGMNQRPSQMIPQGQMKAVSGRPFEADIPHLQYQLGDPLSEAAADIETGAPFMQRAAASIKMTPEGKKGYLESVYGQGNVALRADGEVFYRPEGKKQWVKFDESKLSASDIADITGAGIEALPPIAAGFTTANPLAIGGAAAGGNILRQGISAAMPGEDKMSIGQRLMQPALAFGLGAGGQKLANIWGQGIRPAIDPRNIPTRMAQKGMMQQADDIGMTVGRRGELLQQETGIQMTPGQLSQSKGLLTLEGLARRHPLSADDIAKFDALQKNQAMKHIASIADNISTVRADKIQVGAKVKETFTNKIDDLYSVRRKQASNDFGLVDKLAGKNPIIPHANLRAEIADIADEFEMAGAGDAAASLISKAKKFTNELSDVGLTGAQAQRALNVYGKINRKGSDEQQKMLAGRIVSAIQRDLDDTANLTGYGADVVEALRVARDNYRVNSGQINEIEKSTLGRLFGGRFDPEPEKIAEKFLNMRGSAIKESMGILSGDPATHQMVKRSMLESALDAAVPPPSRTAAGGPAFSPAQFNSFIQKHAEQYRAAYSPRELGKVKRTFDALQRMADRAGTDGSPTKILDIAMDLVKGTVSLQPKFVAEATGQRFAMKKLSQAMTTQKGRDALMTISKLSESEIKRRGAATYLVGLWGKEEVMQTPSDATQTGTPEQIEALQ